MKISWNLLWLLFLQLCSSTEAQYEFYEGDPHFFNCSPDRVDYEWQRLNFYELLGLSPDADKSLDAKDIRKAYRKQAQAWHPDKRKPDEAVSIEEINSRFAQISQAYETLSDSNKKQAYDRFLEQCERRDKQKTNGNTKYEYQSSRGDGHYYYHRDQQQYQYNPYQQHYDPYKQYYDAFRHPQQRHQHHQHYQNMQQRPSNLRKSQEMLVDPMTGAPILRETIFEEYRDLNYYRILVQDFLVETMDAWGNSYYHPIYPSGHMMVEEGQLFQPPTNTLRAGEFLRTGGGSLVSSNGKYRAKIQNCQLVIQENNQPPNDDGQFLWKTDNDIPFTMAMGATDVECFLALEGNTLCLAGGSPEFYTGDILWRSTVDEDKDSSFGFSPIQEYIARLDDDGTLAVYMLDNISPFSSSGSTEDDAARLTCIYATGLLGCNPGARKVRQLAITAKLAALRFFHSTIGKTKFSEEGASYESEDELDDDVLDRVLRFLNRARKTACDKLAQKSLRFVHIVGERWKARRRNTDQHR